MNSRTRICLQWLGLPGFAVLLFLLVAGAGMLRRPDAARYYKEGRLVWDAVHFHTIATRGYILEDPGLGNYFPLWPLVLRTVFPQDVLRSTGLPTARLAFALFVLSLIPVSRKLIRLFGTVMGGGLLIAWALNPMSIFHALSYSESLFCLWAALFLLVLPDRTTSRVGLFVIAAAAACSLLMSLTRNVAIQLTVSAAFASAMCAMGSRDAKIHFPLSVAIAVAAVAGFSIFGFWSLRHYGDFFHVFTVQSHWEKRVGIDWTLLYRPKTWTPSTNVLFWDVLAFYLPVAITGYAMIETAVRRRPRAADGGSGPEPYDYTFWFSAMFALTHAGIVWLTQPDFHSLARYVFAIPFTFVALGSVLERMPRRVALGVLIAFILLSAIFLANWWGRFGRLSWLG